MFADRNCFHPCEKRSAASLDVISLILNFRIRRMLERSSKIHSNCKEKRKIPEINSRYNFRFYLQQQAALMAAATAQGTYINPMAALAHVGAGQLPHALNGMPNPVVPPTSGTSFVLLFLFPLTTINLDISYSFTSPEYRVNETVRVSPANVSCED